MKTQGKSASGSTKSNKASNNGGMQNQLTKLFEQSLKDIYWVEKTLTKAIPKMAENATSDELKAALQSHLMQTQEQVKRVEQVFEILGKKATTKKCEAMEGLIKEAEEVMEECEEGPMCDAGIIASAQKVEHYEIASYGTLSQWAETLNLSDAVALLEQTLNEEKEADEKLTEVAVSAVNIEANEQHVQ